MGSLHNDVNPNEQPPHDSPSLSGEQHSVPTNNGDQFLDAVRENDGSRICNLAALITSKCRIFTESVPALTRGLFDEHPSVRSNAAYLLSEGLHWIHTEDLNSWVLPCIIRALDTLDAKGPLIWLSKRVGFLANEISDQNAEEFIASSVRVFKDLEIGAAELVTIAPFGFRLPKNLRENVLEVMCEVLRFRTKLFTDVTERPDMRDRDPLRMALPSVGVAVLNFIPSASHARIPSHELQSKDRQLIEELENVLFQYVESVIVHSLQKCFPLSNDDKTVILPVASCLGNSSIEWSVLFSEFERHMYEHRDSFAAVLCRLLGSRKVADPLTVITQARDELLSGKDFLLAISTLENAYSSLTHSSLKGKKQLTESIEILQEIQELTLSSYVAFFAQRVKEVLSYT